jgi:hypothetical protein
MGGRRPRRDWLGMIGEHVEHNKLLRERIVQWEARHEKLKLDTKLEVWRLLDIIDAQRKVIERLSAQGVNSEGVTKQQQGQDA